MKILDIGCGSRTSHRFLEGENILHIDIDKTADADVLMDVNHLGFKPESFDIVYASHLLEHMRNPNVAIRQMKRLTNKTIIIKCPNATYFKTFQETTDHMFSWNLTTFENFLRKHFSDVKVYGNSHRVQEARGRLARLKLLVLSLLLGDDELIAVCNVRKKRRK